MSVDSFIQARVSVDTGSEHSSAPHNHGHNPHIHGSLRSRAAEPALDPRWQVDLPGGAAAEHAFLESIANELADTERQAIHAATPVPASSVPSRVMSDSEDSHSAAGSRRHSVLRNRLKHGKTSSSMNRSLTSAPIGGSSIGTAYSQNNALGSIGGSASAVDSRSSLSTASQTTANSTRRSAVSSSGVPALPTSPPPPVPATPSIAATLPTLPALQTQTAPMSGGSQSTSIPTVNRRANAPGPINVARQRTYSLGGTAASSSASNLPATAPLRLATDELPSTPDDSEYCIAFVGANGCGKSTLIRKITKSYPTIETGTFQTGEITVYSTVVQVNIATSVRPIRILEVDSAAVAYPGNLWPQELPRLDGVLLCYDASNEDSYTRIPELVAGYNALGHAVVILACKSDLHKAISPSRADTCGKPYDIGLVEVSAVTEAGKKKLRACFNWEIKAIGRHRRAGHHIAGPYRNPASPDILQASRSLWDNTRVPSATPPLTQSSSSSSIVPRHSNNSAPVLPILDTHSVSIPSATSSTTRTSIDSVLGGSSTTPMTPSRRRSPSLPSSPSRPRLTADSSSSDVRGARPREAATTSATPSPIPAPVPAVVPIETSAAAATSGSLLRNTSSSSFHQQTSPSSATSPVSATPVTATAPTTSIGGGGPVPDGSRNQRESSSLQWATLDEILDKLLFVSVSGDDPVFIQHFFLTYRRFASPRSVLLGMQKRMRQLGQETRDPLLAKFAQMRICNLLSQWKENYPTDFGAPGTFGALSALLKQIVSNVHLVHYASDLLPFLEEVPKLIDRETTWAKKDEVVGDDSEEESVNGTDEEIILPALDDDDETYVGKGKAFEKRTIAASNPPPPPQLPTDNRPYAPKASSSAPNVATISNTNPPVPPIQVPPRGMQTPSGYSNDLHETVITFDRPLNRSARVNIKELRNTAQYIIQTEPVHTAQEITRRMLILFKRIEARDWLRRTLSTKGYDKEHDAIGQLGRLFNYLCCWVSAMIVVHDRPPARARVVDKMILIAKALRQLNNYMGMKAFVAGINSVRGNDDEELTQIMAAKPNSNWKQFQSLHLLLGSARMGQAYRLALKHTVGPAIPDLERHGSDLLRTNEANLDYNPQDPNLIHWGKFTIMGKLVGTVTLYQNRCHTMPDYRDLEERLHITNLVFGQVVWDYDTLMSREARALEDAQTTESSSSGLRRLLFKG